MYFNSPFFMFEHYLSGPCGSLSLFLSLYSSQLSVSLSFQKKVGKEERDTLLNMVVDAYGHLQHLKICLCNVIAEDFNLFRICL